MKLNAAKISKAFALALSLAMTVLVLPGAIAGQSKKITPTESVFDLVLPRIGSASAFRLGGFSFEWHR